MSRNGSGTYSLPAGNPVVTNTTISSTWANTTLGDIANALTGSLATDGQTTATGNLNLGNNKIINLDDGTEAGDAVNYSQLLSAVGGAGKVVQTVVGTSGAAYTTGTSYTSTGMSATITPTSATSKILILHHAMLWQTNYYSSGANGYTALYKNGANVVSGANWWIVNSPNNFYGASAYTHLDSPATTSAVTYAIYFRASSGGDIAFNSDGNAGSIILLEITV
jgi:hypothetical protein